MSGREHRRELLRQGLAEVMSNMTHLPWNDTTLPGSLGSPLAYATKGITCSSQGNEPKAMKPDLPMSPPETPTYAPSTGTQFLDLPAEIRLNIYSHLLFGHGARIQNKSAGPYQYRAPIPPPLSRVSRSLRQEVLEYWYSQIEVPLYFRLKDFSSSPMGLQGTPSYELVSSAPKPCYPMMRKLRLHLDHRDYRDICGVSNALLSFNVVLDKGANTAIVQMAPNVHPRRTGVLPEDVVSDPRSMKVARRLEKKFQDAMGRVLESSGGVGAITFKDFKGLTPRPEWCFWRDMPE